MQDEVTVMNNDHDPSTSAFLNAFLREYRGWTIDEEGVVPQIVLDVPTAGGGIEVPVYGPRGMGRWRLGRPRWRRSEGLSEPIHASTLAELLLGEASICRALQLDDIPMADRARFIARVAASERTMAQTLRVREGELRAIFTDSLGFLAAEQSLLSGHSTHPTPRAQTSEITTRLDPYEPTTASRICLEWVAVRRDRLLLRTAHRSEPSVSLPEPPPELTHGVDPEFLAIPLHPLQVHALSDVLSDAQSRGTMRRLGSGGPGWAPTSSMRTLFLSGAPVMLKCSLPVRLTNSMRTLTIEELDRGLTASKLFDQTDMGSIEHQFPWFRVLREPAYYGLVDADNTPWETSFVALRDNPFTAEQPAEVLATLVQDHPHTGMSRLATRITDAAYALGRSPVQWAHTWFANFLLRVGRPILTAQADYGLLLSAHQQNLVLGLRGLEIDQVWFRDMQGTAYSPLARERFAEIVPSIAGACFEPPVDGRLFAYSFVINSVFNVMASLTMIPGVREAPLRELFRAELEWLRAQPLRDTSVLTYLLEDSCLWAKGNLRCGVRGLNEATLNDPMSIYYSRPNPLRGSSVSRRQSGISPCNRTVAGVNHVRNIEWEDPKIGECGQVRQIGRIDGRVAQLDLDGGAYAEIQWSTAPGNEVIALLSDHVFSVFPGLLCIRHCDPASHLLEVVVRESLLQTPGIWHHRKEAGLAVPSRVKTRDIDHPRRPATEPGLLYRRQCAGIDRVFSLRRFEYEEHFDRFVQWMNDPTVAEFWEQAWSRPRLRAYIEEKMEDPHMSPMVGYFDDEPFAYFESYWAKENRLGAYYEAEDYDRGFHMAVGEERFRFRGFGRHWFLSMAHFLFLDEPRTQRLVGEPRVDQVRVHSWGKSTPWTIEHSIEFPHKRAVLMLLRREDFFADFGGVE